MDIQLKRGYLEICVLAAMLKGETYGYELVREISGYVELSESTLYPILKRLEGSKCVTVRTSEHNGRLRKYYSITQAGYDRISDFMKDWQSIFGIYQYIKEEYDRSRAELEGYSND